MASGTRTRVTGPTAASSALRLNTATRKAAALLLLFAVSGVLVYRTWWVFLAAWITRNKEPDPAIYERAIRYDPANADYHFVLAQIYNYSAQYLDTERAGEEYNAAVRLNPNRAGHWEELARFYEQQQRLDDAREATRMALEKDPNFAQTHWVAANLYIRIGDLDAADRELRRAADLDTPGYLPQTLDLVWTFYEDPERIMSTHVPETREALLIALNYFVAKSSRLGADLAWNGLKQFETKPQDRFAFVDFLVGLGRTREAALVFAFPDTPQPFYNGSFEAETLNGGFDWRILSTDAAEARRDTSSAKEGTASFLVSFTGKENLDYAQVSHWLAVERGRRYSLGFWMKTEAISTNEGVYVEVDGQSSEKQLGTTYWQQFRIPFTASADLVSVRLRRVPTSKFDNLLKGKVWLDGFDLAALP